MPTKDDSLRSSTLNQIQHTKTFSGMFTKIPYLKNQLHVFSICIYYIFLIVNKNLFGGVGIPLSDKADSLLPR